MNWRVWVAVVAALAGASCAPELNWRDVRADEAGARLLFPCRPVRQQRELVLGGRSRTMVLHACEAGGVGWGLAIVQLHAEQERQPVERELAMAVRANMGADASDNASTISPSDRTVGVPVQRWRGRAPDGRPIEAVTSFAHRAGWLAQVTVVGPALPQDDALAFVASLRFEP